MDRRLFFIVIATVFLVLSVRAALATPVSPVSLNILSTGSRQLPTTSNGTMEAQGGNITEVNIDALTITKAWQGYVGNITGNIHLDDAGNNSFYIWGNGTFVSGEIYASRNSTIQWTNTGCANDTVRDAEDTYLGLNPSDGDSVVNTFSKTNNPQFYVGTTSINASSCYSTNVFVNGSPQDSSFYQMLLADDASNLIYTTIIENNKNAYDGRLADFQLMVGENEHPENLGPTPYYFFVEIS